MEQQENKQQDVTFKLNSETATQYKQKNMPKYAKTDFIPITKTSLELKKDVRQKQKGKFFSSMELN